MLQWIGETAEKEGLQLNLKKRGTEEEKVEIGINKYY